MFAVVDIETTGGSPRTEKITEIAIYIHDGLSIVDSRDSAGERRLPLGPGGLASAFRHGF